MRGNANVPLETANGRMNKLYCGMILKTKTPTSEVASWLQANCTGQWDLHPTGIALDGKTKKYMVLLENELDRLNFQGRFGAIPDAA